MKASSYYTTLLFSIFLGAFGADRIYTGSYFLGILKFITAGFGGIWWTIDLILLLMGSYKDGDGDIVTGNAQDEKFETKLGFSLRLK
jgi:TM2 domain-containing membrane protein YozV